MPKNYAKERFVQDERLIQTLFCAFEGKIRSLVHSGACCFPSLHVIWNGFFPLNKIFWLVSVVLKLLTDISQFNAPLNRPSGVLSCCCCAGG